MRAIMSLNFTTVRCAMNANFVLLNMTCVSSRLYRVEVDGSYAVVFSDTNVRQV